MNKKHILMIKQHNITKLKYLCYHFGDEDSCMKYRGSGLIWKRHIRKHGVDISTTILEISDNHEYIKNMGKYYSEKFNVVLSKDFANLMIETADATGMHSKHIVEKARRNQIDATKKRGGVRTEKQKLGDKKRGEILSKKFKGVSMKEKYGDNWVSPNKGVSLKERYGEDYVFWQQGISKREIYGEEWVNPRKGKTLKEQYGGDWKNPRIGKSMKHYRGEEWVHPKKGKTAKERYGDDYISKGKAVMLIINDEIIKEFKSITECSDFTKITIAKLSDYAKLDSGYFIKRRTSSTKHEYPVSTKIQILKK